MKPIHHLTTAMMKRTKIRIVLIVSVGILSLAYPSAQQMPPPRSKPSAPEPAKPRPRPAEKEKAPEATLVITADMAATISVDANEIGSFARHEVRSIRVGLGQHLVRAVAGDLMWEQVVTADKAVQMVVRTGLLEVKAQREKAPAAQQDEAPRAAEAERDKFGRSPDEIVRAIETKYKQHLLPEQVGSLTIEGGVLTYYHKAHQCFDSLASVPIRSLNPRSLRIVRCHEGRCGDDVEPRAGIFFMRVDCATGNCVRSTFGSVRIPACRDRDPNTTQDRSTFSLAGVTRADAEWIMQAMRELLRVVGEGR